MTTLDESVEDHPKLRPVEAFPVQIQQERMICLRDPEQIACENIFLSQPAFFITSHFNGQASLREVQTAFFRRFGEIIYLEKIQELVRALDDKGFLDSETFRQYRHRLEEEFRSQDARDAAHAGGAYEMDPERLRRQIDGYFSHPEGAHSAHPPAGAQALRAVVAPHIDFHRGGPVYSWAYGALRDAPAHDLYVIFGTCHTHLPQPFCLTRKDFRTPIGVAETDRELAGRLIERSRLNLLEGEWAHRSEHSIEFQVVYLKYLFPDRPLKILPILCGNILQESATRSDSLVSAEVREFLGLLREIAEDSGMKVCFIAGADLAHMGPRFGDSTPVSADLLNWLREKDADTLRKVERLDGAAFLEDIVAERDRRRICGLAPIFSLLEVCAAEEGKLLRYGQASDPEGTQVVSFASMAFF